MNIEDKIQLVKRNTDEIIGENELEQLFKEKKEPSCYIGTAPTGTPHIGYFVWALKIADLLKAGFKVKILLADLHAALDNTPWNLLEERYKYYSKIIPLMIEAIGADTKKLECIKGSKFQMSKEYIYDLFKMSSITSVHDCHKAASEVVKLGESPRLSGYIYPLMQALDEQYLEVDMQVGGTDQRKIMVLAREKLPQIGYKKRIELLTPLLPGLIGEKMSASQKTSKIDLLDNKETIKTKIKKADFEEGNAHNGVMAFFEKVIFTIKKDKKENLTIQRPEKYGGDIKFSSYEELEDAVTQKKVHPLDVKMAFAEEIITLLKPIHAQEKTLKKIAQKAYPDK